MLGESISTVSLCIHMLFEVKVMKVLVSLLSLLHSSKSFVPTFW